MKHMSDSELAQTHGGLWHMTVLTGAAVTALGYMAKDLYDNWDVFKREVARGWNFI